jgi:hypothetical protein
MAMNDRNFKTLCCVERRARFGFGCVAIAVAVMGLCLKTGLVDTRASYDRQSWYLVTEHDGFMVTSQVEDERSCRLQETTGSGCRSGKSLIEKERNRTSS